MAFLRKNTKELSFKYFEKRIISLSIRLNIKLSELLKWKVIDVNKALELMEI